MTQEIPATHSCHATKKGPDYFFWLTFFSVFLLYFAHFFDVSVFADSTHIVDLCSSVFDLINTMWWGVLMGVLMVSVLVKVPKTLVMSVLGTESGFKGIIRATAAGVLLDLCSHGILMVGATLYERGASIGQVMAFLIASPWNSFSLTFILFALIGLPWTVCFILLSMIVAIIVGVIFDALVKAKRLPSNPSQLSLPKDFQFWRTAKQGLSNTTFNAEFFRNMLVDGLKESKMVVRWMLIGVILASLIRVFVTPEQLGTYFGPTFLGLALSMLFATLLEVCSEGATPIAADLLTRAKAPGNSFAFLMTGVATDYTEIMVLRERTKSWKIALYLPLLTVPQVLFIAWILNFFA